MTGSWKQRSYIFVYIHHHKHQGLDPLICSISRVTAALAQSCASYGDSELGRVSSGCITTLLLRGALPYTKVSVLRCRGLAFIRSSLLQLKLHCPGITSEDMRKSDLLAELTDVLSDGVSQDLVAIICWHR